MTRKAARPRTVARRTGSSPTSAERLLAEPDRVRGLAVVVADDRSQAQRHRPAPDPGAAAAIAALEDRVRLDDLRDVDEQAFRGRASPAGARRRRARRGRELARPLVERCGVERRTARPGVRRGRLERRGDASHRGPRSHRPGGGLARRRTSRSGRGSRGRAGARPGSPSPITACARSGCVNRIDPAVHRRRPPPRPPATGPLARRGRRDEACRASARSRRRPAGAPPGSPPAGRRSAPRRARRASRGSAGARPASRPGRRCRERAGDLERVERVAAGRLLDPDEHEARERSAEAGQEQLMERGQRHRPDVGGARAAPSGTPATSSSVDAVGVAAHGEEHAHAAGRRGAGSRRPGSSAEPSSSHCASSIARTSGALAGQTAGADVAVATDSVRWSGSWPDGSARRSAISRACRWTAGSAASPIGADLGRGGRSARRGSAGRSDSAGAERRTIAPPLLRPFERGSPDGGLADPRLTVDDEAGQAMPRAARGTDRRLRARPAVR